MVALPAIWVEGEAKSELPLPDRGLDFGDGLFETLLIRSGTPILLDLHLQRLAAGLEVLAFPDCLARVQHYLEKSCQQLADTAWAALRLTVTRGGAPRGYAPPENAQPRVIITAAALEQDRMQPSAPINLQWANIRWSEQPLLAGIKHLNRLEQVLAAKEIQQRGCDEVVVMDQRGQVCSASAANIFILSEGRLLTPAIETCGIAGTRRRAILEHWAPALSLPVEQGPVTRDQLLAADEVFCCNSLRGLQPVAQLGDTRWDRFDTCEALHSLYQRAMAC